MEQDYEIIYNAWVAMTGLRTEVVLDVYEDGHVRKKTPQGIERTCLPRLPLTERVEAAAKLVDVITLQHVVEGQRMIEVRFIDSREVKYVPVENLYMQYLVYPRRSSLFSTPSWESLPRKHISGQRQTL